MKQDYWNRLAEVARQAAAEPPSEMPFGFDSRVLADWRAQHAESESIPWALLLRGALACSALIMVVSLALNYHSLRDREPGPVAIADAALRMSMLP